MNIVNKSDFVASIVLFLTGIIFYFIIIPQEIILEDEAVIGPDLLPNICIILITFLAVLLFFKSIGREEIIKAKMKDIGLDFTDNRHKKN